MDIELINVPQSEFEQVFTAVKEGIFPYVEALFGWDDQFQRDRLTSSYRNCSPRWH